MGEKDKEKIQTKDLLDGISQCVLLKLENVPARQNSSQKVNDPFSCACIRYSYSAKAFMPSPKKVLQLRFGIELPKQTSPSREEPKAKEFQ